MEEKYTKDSNVKLDKNYSNAYNKAIEGRNHHYSNYNYWMNFFAIILGALFVAYYSINSSESTAGQADRTNMEVAITSGENTASAAINQTNNSARNIKFLHMLIPFLGFFVTFCWFLSFRGYYHWMKSWISVVQFYEQKLGGTRDIYGLYYNGTGFWNQNISTQKVFQIFLFVILVVWFSLAWSTKTESCQCLWWELYVSLIFAPIFLFGIFKQKLASNVDYHKVIARDEKGEFTGPNYLAGKKKFWKSCCIYCIAIVILLLPWLYCACPSFVIYIACISCC